MNQEAKVLTSWQEIAAYLGKGVRTVQRWEQLFGLPVRRLKKAGHTTVVEASTQELDEWLTKAWALRGTEIHEELRRSINDNKRLCKTDCTMPGGIRQLLNSLKDSQGRLEFCIGEFIRTDLELGISLASFALSSNREETRNRFRTDARKAYDTARRFSKEYLTRGPTAQPRLLTLRNLLLQLGETIEE